MKLWILSLTFLATLTSFSESALANRRERELNEIASHLVQVMTTTKEKVSHGLWSIDRLGTGLTKVLPQDKKIRECQLEINYESATHEHSASLVVKVGKVNARGDDEIVEIRKGSVKKDDYVNSFVSKDSEDTWISLPGWVDSSSFAVIARRLEEGDLDHIKSRVKYVVMAAVESPVTVHIYGSDYAVASFWDYGSDKHSFADDKLIKVAFNVKEGKVVSILGVSAEAGMLKDGIDNRVDIACGEI